MCTSGGGGTDGIGATVPREWSPGARPEGSHHGAWGRPFHRESAAPGVTSKERRGTSITHNFLRPCQEISPMLRYVDDRFIQTVHSFSRGLRGASCG
jgi:hypothetical protein